MKLSKKSSLPKKSNNRTPATTKVVPKWADNLIVDTYPQKIFVIVNTATGQIFKVDKIAALFCKLINNKRSLKEISNLIQNKTQMSSDLLYSESKKLVSSLKKNKLIYF